MIPKFREVDLSKSERHTHPDVKTDGTYYLAKFLDDLHFGTFSKQWYGLNFDCEWGASGMQFDAPGTNGSAWQGLWELENTSDFVELDPTAEEEEVE